MDSRAARALRQAAPVLLTAGVLTVVVGLSMFWKKTKIFLEKGQKKRARVVEIVELSHDTKRFRISLGGPGTILGLPVGKHIAIFAPNPKACLETSKWNNQEDADKGKSEIERKYTPVTGDETPGHVDLVIKIYRPGVVKTPDGREIAWKDGGKLSLFMDSLNVGDSVDMIGPLGVNEYLGRGVFKLPGRTVTAKNVGMLAGGTGLTPMLQVAQAAMRDPEDTCTFSLIYANKTEDDILCREMLDELAKKSQGRFRVIYTLDFPPVGWSHRQGFITTDMIKECLPGPSPETLVLMCGPPPMIQFACKKNLEALQYPKISLVAF